MEKSELIAKYFAEFFNNIPSNKHTSCNFIRSDSDLLEDIDFDILTVSNTLKNLPNKNSSAPNDLF